MKALQLNVRFSEGGAARVARTLHDELSTHGISSTFAYGYGPHGKSSPEAHREQALRITPRPLVGIHKAAHTTLGREAKLRSRQRWRALESRIADSDVVHLHVLHSYYVSFESLVNSLIKYQKPVVWTLHDQWALTGRCALPGDCKLWADNCPSCPHKEAYPPAAVDHAHRRSLERRRLIERLSAEVPFAMVACAEWLAEKCRSAGYSAIAIANSVDGSFWRACQQQSPRSPSPRIRVLFMCRDLRDPDKVDWTLLEALTRLPNIQLTIVGDHAPRAITGATHLPAQNSRETLAEVFAKHDRLVFTSQVDHSPLILAEALTAGLEVVASDSPASREMRRFPAVRLCHSQHAFTELSQAPLSPATRSHDATDFFSPARMASEYASLYKTLTGWHAA